MSRALDKARAAVTKAESAAAKWVTDTAAYADQIESHEATSGAAVVDDPDAVERIGDEIARLRERRLIASSAIPIAASRVDEAWRRALAVEAGDEDADAALAEKVATQHRVKVDACLATLRELDGVDYAPKVHVFTGNVSDELAETTVQSRLDLAAWTHQLRAAALRHVSTNRVMPTNVDWQAWGVVTWANDPESMGLVPDSVRQYVAEKAGMSVL